MIIYVNRCELLEAEPESSLCPQAQHRPRLGLQHLFTHWQVFFDMLTIELWASWPQGLGDQGGGGTRPGGAASLLKHQLLCSLAPLPGVEAPKGGVDLRR